MKHGRNKHPYRVIALAARAALRFTTRRNAPNRHAAWRPIALFWRRQKRKGPEGVRASRVAPASGAMRLPQFHLHFITRVSDSRQRDSKHQLSQVTVFHLRQVVTDYQRTIVQSGMVTAQPLPAQSLGRVFSLPRARGDSGTNIRAAARYADPARRLIVPPTATWAADRAQRLKLGLTYPSVRFGSTIDAQVQTLQPPRTYKREPYLFRAYSAVRSNVVPLRSQESVAAQLYFHPPELVWRRAVPPAAEIANTERQVDLRELVHHAHGRSYPEKEAASGMPQAFGHALAPPVLQIDSGLVDRLADDVIRRVERHARIERERRGL